MIANEDFLPDWASAPGETIADILEEQNLSRDEFARRIGRSTQEADALLRGQERITLATAKKLESILGSSTSFWMARECQFREDLKRIQHSTWIQEDDTWLSEIPLRDMIKYGWVNGESDSKDQTVACLQFFGVSSVRQWREKYNGYPLGSGI